MFYYEYNCVILETLIFLTDQFKEPKRRHSSIIDSIENRPFILRVDQIDDILNDEYR